MKLNEKDRQKDKTIKSKNLTTGGRICWPHQFLLSRSSALAVSVYPDAVKTQQVFFTGDLNCADGIHWLMCNK